MFDIEPRELGINLALIFLSVIVVLAGMEAGLRLMDVNPYENTEYPEIKYCEGYGVEEGGRMQFHPVYGFKSKSNIRFLQKGAPNHDWTLWTINSEGFRDTYDSGDSSVIVLGDSFVEGWLVDDNATFPHLLDRWTPRVAIKNRGMAGYGTDQELLLYRNISERYDHDLVILGYYKHNDMLDNYNDNNRNPRPLFAVRDGELVQIHQPQRPQDNESGNGTGNGDKNQTSNGNQNQGIITSITSHPIVDGFQEFLREHTYTYGYLAPRAQTVLVKLGIYPSRPNPKPPTGDALDKRLRLTRALLDALAAEAAEQDADVLIVVFPDRGEVTPENPTYFEPEDAKPYWDAQRRMLGEVAKEHQNVGVLSMTPHLKNETKNGDRVYSKYDEHLVENGYRVTAQVIYQRMVKDGYIEPNEDADFTEHYTTNSSNCGTG